ncbi:hypothetical protein JYU14_01335 [Simkania negevensis]|uniref:Uncharacterized protein n=1 Tax=Simkania negevensis TaxID=83561 RepID=A0ABS3APT4_9BACT|nr:hypothetical protein [Simkania negevensis]
MGDPWVDPSVDPRDDQVAAVAGATAAVATSALASLLKPTAASSIEQKQIVLQRALSSYFHHLLSLDELSKQVRNLLSKGFSKDSEACEDREACELSYKTLYEQYQIEVGVVSSAYQKFSEAQNSYDAVAYGEYFQCKQNYLVKLREYITLREALYNNLLQFREAQPNSRDDVRRNPPWDWEKFMKSYGPLLSKLLELGETRLKMSSDAILAIVDRIRTVYRSYDACLKQLVQLSEVFSVHNQKRLFSLYPWVYLNSRENTKSLSQEMEQRFQEEQRKSGGQHMMKLLESLFPEIIEKFSEQKRKRPDDFSRYVDGVMSALPIQQVFQGVEGMLPAEAYRYVLSGLPPASLSEYQQVESEDRVFAADIYKFVQKFPVVPFTGVLDFEAKIVFEVKEPVSSSPLSAV